MTLAYVAVLACGAAAALAGDYQLIVSNDSQAACIPRQASIDSASWPVRRGEEVAEDVLRHFRGEQTRLAIFQAAFRNARVTFCGASEREAVYAALAQAASSPRIKHEADLYDYAFLLATETMVRTFEDALSASDDAKTSKRLRKMVGRAREGVNVR